MKLIFSCSISISHSFAALTRETDRVEHSKINLISPRAHVIFSIYANMHISH